MAVGVRVPPLAPLDLQSIPASGFSDAATYLLPLDEKTPGVGLSGEGFAARAARGEVTAAKALWPEVQAAAGRKVPLDYVSRLLSRRR